MWENDSANAGGILNLGFTGLMRGDDTNWQSQFDPGKMTAGGAAGVMTVDEAGEGTARGDADGQQYGFQFGVNVSSSSPRLYAHTRVLAPFAGLTPQAGQEIGMYIGNGDQDNYAQLAVTGNDGGSVEFVTEVGGVTQTFGATTITLADVEHVDLYIILNPATMLAEARFSVTTAGGTTALTQVVGGVALPSSWVGAAAGMAVGLISTSAGPAPTFPATWDFVEVLPVSPGVLGASVSRANFGGTTTGGTVTKSITFTNLGAPGDPDIILDATTIAGTDVAAFSDAFDDAGSVTLAPGQATVVAVTFTAGSSSGRKTATLQVGHSGSNTPLLIPLKGDVLSSGLLGEYYNQTDLTGLATTRVDATVNFVDADWVSSPTGTAVVADDNYSERWTGYVKVDTAGEWTFTTNSNDGVRLWVNGVQLVNNWTNHAATENSATLSLQPGWYPIQLEHYQAGGIVAMQLSFAGPGQAKGIIPATHLGTAAAPVSVGQNRLGASLGTVNFGHVRTGRSVTRTVTLTNLGVTGDPDVVIDESTIAGLGAAAYSDSFDDAGSVTLAPGQSMTLTLTFSPAAAGSPQATLSIAHSGDNAPLKIALAGTGVDGEYWTAGTSMPAPLGEVASAVIDGKVYAVGDASNGTFVYDIATNTWTSKAPRPYPAKDQLGQAANGKFYVFGGVNAPAGFKVAMNKVQIYDPATNAWSLGADMPFPTFAASTTVIGGIIFVAGGVTNGPDNTLVTTDQVAKYDPATNAWTMLASMKQGRNSAPGGTDGSRFFIFGGRTGGDEPGNGFDTVQVYDPATNSWISSLDASGPGALLAELPQARGGIVTAPFYNGEFYVIGGETKDGTGATANNVYDRVDIYNPSTNNWRQGPSMLTARHGMSPVLAGNRIFIAGGGVVAGKSSSSLLEVLELM